MITDWHLLIHNILSIASAIIFIAAAFFIYLNSPKKTANITLALTALCAAIFFTSHVVGINLSDPNASRMVLMLNLINFGLGMFQLHAIVALLGLEKTQRWPLIATYAIGVFFIAFFLVFPDLFLLPSVPKMYFPNYYNPGALNWTRMIYLYGLIIPYGTYLLLHAYRQAVAPLEKQQYLFFIISFIGAFGVAFIPNLLIYNIPVDPLWGMICGALFAIPFTYGAVQYGLLNIKVVAKQAFFYSTGVIILGGIIVFLNNSNVWLAERYPGFPSWVIPLISSVGAVTISVVIWRKLRQNELMKYEFVTTVTHKFRTPLTHIKWASENLSKEDLPPSAREQVGYIQSANVSLVELTNLLMNVSEAESQNYEYKMELADLAVTAEETIARIENQFVAKHVHVVKNLTKGKFAHYDASRIRFIIQTFLENAVHYSSDNPAINIMVVREGNEIRCSVTDNGIGIPKEEVPLIFAKFYRGHRARLTDTEGMGIGLFMAKQIIEHHRGRIWAESHGEGLGSTFSFALPAAK